MKFILAALLCLTVFPAEARHHRKPIVDCEWYLYKFSPYREAFDFNGFTCRRVSK